MATPETMYDAFSGDYDHFVDWGGRLTAEMPFIERQLESVGGDRVVDVACGTGMHAIALAKRGYEVVGTDVSEGMVEQARVNAADAEVGVRFKVAGFGEVSEKLQLASRGMRFDALLCLGNSLPHVLTPPRLAEALDDFASCLRPGGTVLIQNRNFDAVLADHDRWMGPQHHQERGSEWLFVRFYDFESDGLLTFNVVTLHQEGSEDWSQRVTSTQLWPLTQHDLAEALRVAGFEDIIHYGDMEGAAFDAVSSPNLIPVARRESGP